MVISFIGASNSAKFSHQVAEGDRARDKNDWRSAISVYREALRLNPTALWVNVQIGHCLKEMGDYPAARAAYLSFLKYNESDPDIHLQLGHLSMLEQAFDEAERHYAKAAELADEGSPVLRDAVAGAAAAKEGPVTILRRRALAFTDERRFAEARSLVAGLVENENQADLIGILGNINRELGRLDEAAKCYDRYRAFAADKSFDLRFDAELQSARLAQVSDQPALALTHFIRAQTLLPSCEKPSASAQEIKKAINRLVKSLTGAFELNG